MDLAEIRKKARLRDTVETSFEDGHEAFQSGAAGVANVDHEEVLESFWEASTGLPVTTEEDYVRTLDTRTTCSEEDALQWLTFYLGSEEYALDLSAVLELIRPRQLTELPRVPDYVLGIVTLRGLVVPVIDLCKRLQLIAADDDSQQRIIVCSSAEQHIGLLVDRVTQVVRIMPEQVEASPLLPEARAKEFVAGVGRLQERMLILLNPEKIMEIDK